MIKRIGKRTLSLENRPYLLGHAAAVGKKEGINDFSVLILVNSG